MMCLYLEEDSETPDTPLVFGHTGSDGTLVWAWPDRDLMVMFFTQSRGSASGLSFETEIHNLLIDPEGAKGTAEVPEDWKAYLGDYSTEGSKPEDTPAKVLFRNGNLAEDIPNRMVFELNGPDEIGRWSFKLSADVKVSFTRDESGAVNEMVIAQLIKLMQSQKTPAEDIPEDVPAEYRPWLGTYPVPAAGFELTLLYQDGNLAVNDPNEGIVTLKGPDEEGLWIDQYDKNQMYFQADDKGRIVFNLIANNRYKKKE